MSNRNPEPASAPALFAFLTGRTLLNLASRRLQRLRQPRYLIGLVVALLYFGAFVFDRGSRRPSPKLEPDSVVFLAAAYGLTAMACVSWLFLKGKAALPLSEADIQFLFPAPLSRRAVLHFVFLRSQLMLLASSAIVAVVFRGRFGAEGLRTWIGTWVLLTALQLQTQVRAFTKARWDEAGPRKRSIYQAASAIAAVLTLVALGRSAYQAREPALAMLSNGLRRPSRDLLEALRAGPFGTLASVLVWPARALVAPLALPTGLPLLAGLLGAFAVLVAHYALLFGAAESFEDATVENAARLASLRERTRSGLRVAGPKSRHSVPFRLQSRGVPQVAIVWKNLLMLGRTPLIIPAGAVLGLSVVLFLAALATVRRGPHLFTSLYATIPVMGFLLVMLATLLPFGLRIDLRADLCQADLLRSWPISPARLVAGQLATPLLVSTLSLWAGLLLTVSTALGFVAGAPHAALSRTGLPRPELLVSVAAGLGILMPAIAALVLVIQNAAVLAFPAWFPPGLARTSGFANMGGRILLLLGTTILLSLAVLPAVLFAAPIMAFARPALGDSTYAIAAFAASVPLWAEAGVAIHLLARLLARFDPVSDLQA